MENLNQLELAIFESLSIDYPSIKIHVPLLKVSSREITGVGMYVNFADYELPNDTPTIESNYGVISTNENIEIQELEFGLVYEVNLSNEKIMFIEMVTYGEEEWSGYIGDFKLTKQ